MKDIVFSLCLVSVDNLSYTGIKLQPSKPLVSKNGFTNLIKPLTFLGQTYCKPSQPISGSVFVLGYDFLEFVQGDTLFLNRNVLPDMLHDLFSP